MELKNFIRETLLSIVEGVQEAQREQPLVAAEAFGIGGDRLLHGGTSGMFTLVGFDVAVTAETDANGKAQVKVWGVELGGGGSHKFGQESRVQFAVHVKLPVGEKARRT